MLCRIFLLGGDKNMVTITLLFLLSVLLIFTVLYFYFQQKDAEVKAKEMFDMWVQNYRTLLEESIRNEVQMEYEKWRQNEVEKIRKDAIQGSRNVITGQITEQLAPHLPDFPYNPKDARFIGNPIDYVIFDGLSEGNVKQIIFSEVKSGRSGLNKNERLVRNVIDEKNVAFEIYRINNTKENDNNEN